MNQKNQIEVTEFVTSSLDLSTALLTRGYPLLRINIEEPFSTKHKRALFVFPKQVEVEEDVNSYYRHQLSVDARSFAQAGHELKRKMYKEMEVAKNGNS